MLKQTDQPPIRVGKATPIYGIPPRNWFYQLSHESSSIKNSKPMAGGAAQGEAMDWSMGTPAEQLDYEIVQFNKYNQLGIK